MTPSSGLLYPSTVAAVAVSPDAAWSGAANAAASDGASATTTLSVLLPRSPQLRATGFDFSSIPSTARIRGIACHIEVADDGGGSTFTEDAQLVAGGVAVGDKDLTDMPISAEEAVVTYGGEAAPWGLALRRRDLDADFGFQFAAKRTGGGTVVVSVDSLALEVWYDWTSVPAMFPPTRARRGW